MKNLREFVAAWPQGITVLTSNVGRQYDFATMSEDLKWQAADHNWFICNQLEVSCKGTKWYLYHKTTEVKRRGRTFYPKTKVSMKLSIVDGKIVTMQDLMWSHIEELHSRYQWLTHIQCGRFGGAISNKLLLKNVLLGNITNPEDYYKWILKKTYRTDAIPWKLFRDYSKGCMRASVFDLMEATTNPKLAIAVYLDENTDWSIKHLLEDAIISALRLGEKINPLWSIKRLQAEHQRQIEAVQLKRIDAMESTPASHVLDAYDFPLGVKWLNTEGDVFREATRMHHCLHSNYWSRIKRGDYVAFAIDHNDEHFTLGCRFNGDFCMYDQAHTIYNGSVSHENMMFINDLIRDIDQFLAKQRELVGFDWDKFTQDYDLPY